MTEFSEPLTVEPDMAGRQLGDYRILHRLGRGAMAEVYLAEQVSLRRQVAFKTLKRSLAADETFVQRFHREAQAAAALVHPNIVHIHEVGCVEGIHFIAQEYVPGQNLRDYLARRGSLPVARAVRLLRQITSALHLASTQGVVHRDIKPENILLAPSGDAKVADFGLAQRTAPGEAPQLTQAGLTLGTPLYMSPEQIEGRLLDSRSDLYSLGVTAYQMLAGQTPFQGETSLSVALQHLNAQPTRLETLRPDAPEALCHVVHRMLAKDPNDRYAQPRDALRDLRALTTGDDAVDGEEDWNDEESPGWTTTVGGEATQRLAAVMRTQTVRLRNRRRSAWVLSALLAAALFVGLGLAWSTRAPFLLEDIDPAAVSVRDMGTAAAQFRYARLVDPSEEGWRAVVRYYPEDPLYAPMARQELAWLYFLRHDYDQAMQLFDEFAQADELERGRRAFGVAGQAVVYHFTGEARKSSAKLAELATIAGREPVQVSRTLGGDAPNDAERRMLQMVGIVIARNQQSNDERTRQQWQEWMQENLPDDSALDEAVDNLEGE